MEEEKGLPTSYVHKLLRIYTEAKLRDEVVDWGNTPEDFIKKAEKSNQLFKFKDNIWICCYKTKYQEEEAGLIVLMMNFTGSPNGTTESSETVMNTVEMFEKLLSPIDNMVYEKRISKNKGNVVFLKIIKKIREQYDLL